MKNSKQLLITVFSSLAIVASAQFSSTSPGGAAAQYNLGSVGIAGGTFPLTNPPKLYVNGHFQFESNVSGDGKSRFHLNRVNNSSYESLLSFDNNGAYEWLLGTDNDGTGNFKMFSPNGSILTVLPATGNVGIGGTTTTGTSPTAKLSVNGDFLVSSSGTSGAPYIQHSTGFSSATAPEYTWYGYSLNSAATGVFHPNPGNIIGFTTGGVEAMRIGNGTNPYVGIGNASPIYPLDVTGMVNSSSMFRSTGTGGNYLLMGWNSSNNVIQSAGSALLVNYGGQDVAICTGASGVVSTGKNAEIGFPIRDLTTSLNIMAATTTSGLKIWNSTATRPVFDVENTGQTFIGAGRQTANGYPNAMLSVNGDVVVGTSSAANIYVTQTNWSDFVFDKEYKLMDLDKLEAFYKENHHLPEVPTTAEIQKNGNNLGQTDAVLLQKIEENTLYIVELKKQLESQRELMNALKKKVEGNNK